jgi:hypothetical protein
MVFGYADRISVVGGFPYTAVTVVLHPTKNKTHFHLVYATRLMKGEELAEHLGPGVGGFRTAFVQADAYPLMIGQDMSRGSKRSGGLASSSKSISLS